MTYWRIGTDLTKYLKNWLQYMSCFSIGEKLEIEGCNIISKSKGEVFICNSKTTLNQNINTWQTFELCKKTGPYTIVITSSEDKFLNQLIDRCKAMMFIKSNNKNLQRLKDTTILKILYLENKIPNNLEVWKQSPKGKITDFNVIKRDILAFEKEIYKDKVFVKAIVEKWGEK